MAKNKDKKVSVNKKNMKLSAVAISENLVFSKTDVWAYYKIRNDVYDFLSQNQKISVSMQISNALNNLMTDKQEPVECHLITTTIPIDIDSWEAQVRGVSENWEQPPGFEKYLQEQAMILKLSEYKKRVCFLGINLGKRGALDMEGFNVFESGFKGATETLKAWLDTVLQPPGEIISAQEEDQYRRKESDYFRTLSVGHLQATRCTSEDLLLLIKRQFYPAMPSPYLDIDAKSRLGPGDLELETGSVIENKYRWTKITQMFGDQEIAGYRAAMSFAKFPKEMQYPYGPFPFLYFPAKLGTSFTVYSRFTLHPSAKMKGDVEKKKKEQKDELENIGGGTAYDSSLPADVLQAIDDIQLISELLASDKTPWIEGSYRLIVEAETEEVLRDYCSELKQRYDDLGILLKWTAGDQSQLFLEQMPGDYLRIKSFKQITNLNMISTSGANFSSDVGDVIFGSDGK